jgi:hypothetical protein
VRKIAVIVLAVAALFTSQVLAQQPHAPAAPGATQREANLSPLTKQTRARLIGNPGAIAAVLKEAAAATGKTRTDIELGIVLAIRYLKAYDPAGYLAIMNVMKANADSAVVADIESALSALASTSSSPGSGAGSSGSGGGGGGGGGGGFTSSPGPPASLQ